MRGPCRGGSLCLCACCYIYIYILYIYMYIVYIYIYYIYILYIYLYIYIYTICWLCAFDCSACLLLIAYGSVCLWLHVCCCMFVVLYVCSLCLLLIARNNNQIVLIDLRWCLSPYKTSKSPSQPGGVPPLCRWASLDCNKYVVDCVFLCISLYHV